jgi:hypothetical protein
MKDRGKAPLIHIDALTALPSGTDSWYHYIGFLSGYLPGRRV